MIVADLREEKKLWKKFRRIAGVDEVGRGALAGPVVAAAVCAGTLSAALKENAPPIPVRDSKHLSARQREVLYGWLIRHPAFRVSVARVSHRTIDAVNIRRATLRAMRRAVRGLSRRPTALLIDGTERPFRHQSPHQYTRIKGDERIFLVALASIAAKVTRDRIMTRSASRYPGYGFELHKGYGTRYHRKMIRRLGPSPLHRRSFLLTSWGSKGNGEERCYHA